MVKDYNYGRELMLDQFNFYLFSANFVESPTTYEASIKI
jgi:hypothetical protein